MNVVLIMAMMQQYVNNSGGGNSLVSVLVWHLQQLKCTIK